MHPNFAASNEVSMIIRNLEIVNRLRLTRDRRNKLNRRPGARDDAATDAQLARFDETTLDDVERMFACRLDSFAVAEC